MIGQRILSTATFQWGTSDFHPCLNYKPFSATHSNARFQRGDDKLSFLLSNQPLITCTRHLHVFQTVQG